MANNFEEKIAGKLNDLIEEAPELVRLGDGKYDQVTGSFSRR